jgi:hypothetical protein
MKNYTITEKENSTEIKIILPGVDREDIKIQIEERPNNIEYVLSPLVGYLPAYGGKLTSYKYIITVSCSKLGDTEYICGVDSEDISAKLDKGILTIVVQNKPKNIKQIPIT